MKAEEDYCCDCGHSNFCIARMYTLDMACHKHLKEKIPTSLQKEIERLEEEARS